MKSTLEIRSGELGKGSSPGSQAVNDAHRNFKARKTIIPVAENFTPKCNYCQYHKLNSPLFCKTNVKFSTSAFENNENHQRPANSKFDSSNFKGGPNPFINKFNYTNPNHTRSNIDFTSQKRMNHAYDRHAEKCFGMKENKNKQTLYKFICKAREFVESSETEKINGSYRYEIPAYLFQQKENNLVAVVNATNNTFVTY